MNDSTASIPDAGSLLDGEPIAEVAPAARRTRQARVAWGGNVVTVGGDAPVRVQSMTNTDTVQVIETAIQVKELALAGSEMVRITVNTPEAAAAVPHIRDQLDRMNINVPLVGDFHYNGHRLLTEHPAAGQQFRLGHGVGVAVADGEVDHPGRHRLRARLTAGRRQRDRHVALVGLGIGSVLRPARRAGQCR